MKKKFIPIILVILIIFVISVLAIYNYTEVKKEKLQKENIKKLETSIKSHYNTYVVTTSKTNLYSKDGDKYIVVGEINKDVKLKLSDIKIDSNTKYFQIDFDDLYIEYDKVKPIEEFIISNRYKNYIPFNINIKTLDKTSFYDEDDNLIYSLNKSFDFVVLIKDNERYGVEYNNELMYIHKSDVEKTYNNINTELKNKTKIKTLTYHFIYDPNTTECNEIICQTFDQFESHLKYFKENNYFTLKLNELELYLDGKLQIPENSVVITIDDGTILDLGALDLLEKYEANATLFVITNWVDPNHFKSDNLDLESHTDDMHLPYQCPGYGSQGGGILCLPEDVVLKDLKLSQEKLGGSKYFAYPFFDFNDRAIELLKKAGFHLAFIGQYDTDGYSYPLKTDKFKVRRKTIFSNTTMDEFISILK